MKLVTILLAFSLSGCAAYQGTDGRTYYWVAPLPNGTGPQVTGGNGRGVAITQGTFTTGGNSTGYSFVTSR
jgi:hypothetical protein